MTKKYFVLVISALFILGIAYYSMAEISTNSYSTKTRQDENQVFTYAYNNQSTTIPQYGIAILDTDANVTNSLGSWVTTTTTANSPYVFGVADELVAANSTGRFCVRGVHQIWHTGTIKVGSMLGTSSTASIAANPTITDGTLSGYIGLSLSNSTTDGVGLVWALINPVVRK